ncbi:MAG: hypothetical protein ACRDIY_19720, partial [Chloroflexota bacterium]
MLDPASFLTPASGEPTTAPATLRRPSVSDASFFAALFRATVLRQLGVTAQAPSSPTPSLSGVGLS